MVPGPQGDEIWRSLIGDSLLILDLGSLIELVIQSAIADHQSTTIQQSTIVQSQMRE